MKSVKVKGISSEGEERSITYAMTNLHCETSYECIRKALEYADREYSCKYDENWKPIPYTEFKEFAIVTSVSIIDD